MAIEPPSFFVVMNYIEDTKGILYVKFQNTETVVFDEMWAQAKYEPVIFCTIFLGSCTHSDDSIGTFSWENTKTQQNQI